MPDNLLDTLSQKGAAELKAMLESIIPPELISAGAISQYYILVVAYRDVNLPELSIAEFMIALISHLQAICNLRQDQILILSRLVEQLGRLGVANQPAANYFPRPSILVPISQSGRLEDIRANLETKNLLMGLFKHVEDVDSLLNMFRKYRLEEVHIDALLPFGSNLRQKQRMLLQRLGNDPQLQLHYRLYRELLCKPETPNVYTVADFVYFFYVFRENPVESFYTWLNKGGIGPQRLNEAVSALIGYLEVRGFVPKEGES